MSTTEAELVALAACGDGRGKGRGRGGDFIDTDAVDEGDEEEPNFRRPPEG